nr:iron chelate uptake ABC transporter family permease subunit [Staphylococcus aureus]
MKISILDDPVAIGLGLHVQRMKLIQLITSTILVSMAISLIGKIGFVGLIAPHIAKTIVRGSYAKKLLIRSASRCIYCCFWCPILHILIINREKVITILLKQNDLTTTLAKCLS